MPLELLKGEKAWFGKIGHIGIYLPDHGNQPDQAQVGFAHEIEENLPSLQLRASSYLDLFVDRAKACGDGNEPWWLEEIEFRTSAVEEPPTYHMNFQLAGDDGGLWSVEMRVNNAEHRPVRFERRQG